MPREDNYRAPAPQLQWYGREDTLQETTHTVTMKPVDGGRVVRCRIPMGFHHLCKLNDLRSRLITDRSKDQLQLELVRFLDCEAGQEKHDRCAAMTD